MSNNDISVTISAEDKTSAIVAEVTRSLDKLSASSAATGRSMATFSASTAQTANAMRMLPMQFTDIVTQLSGGQSALQVLIQQGGQIKDTFGSTGAALRGMGAYVSGLISPLTVVAGAAAALAVAWKQGASELDEYKKKLVLTGNAAGVTANSITAMAREVASATGATKGASTEVLASLNSSGNVSGDISSRLANTALLMERNGGQAAEDTVKDIIALGEAPLATLDKLEGKYHFVTAAVYAQVKALEEQGRVSEAARVAQEALGDALNSRLPALEANLGTLETAWRAIKDGAKGAWDSMLDISRESSLQDKLAQAMKDVEVFSKMGFRKEGLFGTSFMSAASAQQEVDLLKQQIEISDRLKLNEADRSITREAGLAWEKEKAKYQTDEEKRLEKINRIKSLAAAANAPQKEIDQAIAALKDKRSDGIGKSQLGFDLEKLRADLAETTNIYSNAEKIMQAQRAANLIDEETYWRAKEGFLVLNSQLQERELQAEIDRLNRESLSGKDKIDNQKKIVETEAKLAKLRADTSASMKINGIQESAALKKKKQAYKDAVESAKEYIATLQRQYAVEVDGLGRGDKYRTEQAGRARIEDKYTSKKYDLDRDLRNESITRERYEQYLEIARSTRDQELVLWDERNAAINDKQADWTTGAREAFANYDSSARNVAQSTEQAFSSAFSSMEDAFVSFVKTGKFDFKSLAESIIADLARIQARAAMSSVTASLGKWLFGSGATADGAKVGNGTYNASSDTVFSANGNVFSGAAGLHQYVNTVQTTPKFFGFANGGVFAEAGPEAVMPLARDGSGRLGVRSQGGGATNLQVNIIESPGNKKNGTTSARDEGGKTIIDVFVEQVKGALIADVGSGGTFAGAMEGQYGLNRAAGAWR